MVYIRTCIVYYTCTKPIHDHRYFTILPNSKNTGSRMKMFFTSVVIFVIIAVFIVLKVRKTTEERTKLKNYSLNRKKYLNITLQYFGLDISGKNTNCSIIQ